MAFKHKALAAGGWKTLSLMEQLGNIGSEVARAARWQGKDEQHFLNAAFRALELFDLTFDDSRWKERLGEIARAREVFCDAAFNNGAEWHTALSDLDKYFLQFAFAARLKTENGK